MCRKHFIDLASVRVHMVVHTGERLYKCELCDKVYTNSPNLSRHRRVHTGEMPYCCRLCDVRYRDMSSLKLHQLKHTGKYINVINSYLMSSHFYYLTIRTSEAGIPALRKLPCGVGRQYTGFAQTFLWRRKPVYRRHGMSTPGVGSRYTGFVL